MPRYKEGKNAYYSKNEKIRIVKKVIEDHNNYRPSYALNYKTPIEYRTQLGFN